VAYPDVNKIIFDEFILDKGYYHYLTDEVNNFLELYETISRMRIDVETMEEVNPVRVFFLSNAITVSNPYFLYFNMKINPHKRFQHFGSSKDMLVELVANKEFIELKKQTRFGKIIDGTAYGNYAIENNFLRDDKTFIEKKTATSRHYFTFRYYARDYHIWIDTTEGKYFVSKDSDPSRQSLYCLTQSDHSPNTMLTKGKKDWRIKEFIDNYQLGNVYFEDINLKNVFFEIIRLFLL
jgi:hypothetical protein